jgi:hypothetical protein
MPRPGAVVVSLEGGVGNQLFQYAAGLALASERGLPIQVVRGRLFASRALGATDLLEVPAQSLTPYERFLCGLPGGSLRRMPPALTRIVKPLARRRSRYLVIRQDAMHTADPRVDIDEGQRYVHLRGLFQHPSYYEPALADVVSRIVDKLGPRLDPGAGDGVVAMHFRRGDYVLHGYDLPLSFQEEALAMVVERCTVSRILVMSDDQDFARLAAEHFDRGGIAATVVGSDPARSDLDDFCSLASAQHLVMSNSTFVWWAAMVGDHLRPGDDRVVVCPTPWMPLRASGTIPAATLDLSRDRWVLHPVRP